MKWSRGRRSTKRLFFGPSLVTVLAAELAYTLIREEASAAQDYMYGPAGLATLGASIESVAECRQYTFSRISD